VPSALFYTIVLQAQFVDGGHFVMATQLIFITTGAILHESSIILLDTESLLLVEQTREF
jgi:hypothetical protein